MGQSAAIPPQWAPITCQRPPSHKRHCHGWHSAGGRACRCALDSRAAAAAARARDAGTRGGGAPAAGGGAAFAAPAAGEWPVSSSSSSYFPCRTDRAPRHLSVLSCPEREGVRAGGGERGKGIIYVYIYIIYIYTHMVYKQTSLIAWCGRHAIRLLRVASGASGAGSPHSTN